MADASPEDDDSRRAAMEEVSKFEDLYEYLLRMERSEKRETIGRSPLKLVR